MAEVSDVLVEVRVIVTNVVEIDVTVDALCEVRWSLQT